MADSLVLIQNCEPEGGGKIPAELERLSISVTTTHAYKGEALPPSSSEVDGAIVLGTPVSARNYQHHAFLRSEYQFLASMVRDNKPILGICFGAQLLAHLLGARVEKNSQLEIGTSAVTLTSEAVTHPMFRGFPGSFPVFHWHGDTFRLPHGAVHLASSEITNNQAFAKGTCWGIQFHLEPTTDDVSAFASAYPEELSKADLSPEELLTSFQKHEQQIENLLRLLIANFTNQL